MIYKLTHLFSEILTEDKPEPIIDNGIKSAGNLSMAVLSRERHPESVKTFKNVAMFN